MARIATGTSARQTQRLSLTPGLRQGLHLLRLPADSVERYLARELAENPLLVSDAHHDTAPGWQDPAFLRDGPESLVASLHRQIALMSLPRQVRAVAEYLAGELRGDGYLDTPLETLAAQMEIPLPLARAALDAVQACEPPGVGARNLTECLALQLIDRGIPPAVARAVLDDLEALATGSLADVAAGLKLDLSTVECIAALLPELTARPVAEDPAPEAPLRPDLVVERQPDGKLTLRLAPIASLRLDRDLKARMPADDATGWGDHASRATLLIEALAFRGRTLLRIGHALIERQAGFFRDGEAGLAPLKRADLAAELGLHPSTVGRAIAGKALAFQGVLVPLEHLFSTAMARDGHAPVSTAALRRRIAAMIAAEDRRAPLSDEAIRQRLRAEGVDIARRTVAKYREWMRLPSSHQRRRLARLRNAVAAPDGGSGAGRRATKAGPTRNRRRHDADPDQRQAD